MSEELILRIYEAAIVPDRWQHVLQAMAEHCGAYGGAMLSADTTSMRWTASPRAADVVADYIDGGWSQHNITADPLFKDVHPGFRTQTDYWTPEQIAATKVQREFFTPRNIIGGAATVFQGAGDTLLHLTFDGFGSHERASAAVPWLDATRRHLGRAFSLSALAEERRSADLVDHLSLVNVGAAIIDESGRIRSNNAQFLSQLSDEIDIDHQILRFRRRNVQCQYTAARDIAKRKELPIGSLALPADEDRRPLAIHIIPIYRSAQVFCDSAGIVLLIGDSMNAMVPDSDLIRILFDLTPAEAKVARLIANGESLASTATILHVRVETARSHLKSVFVKSGVSRQAELSLLLRGLGRK